MKWLIIIICIALIALAFWIEIKHKRIKSNCVCFISGAPKTGKSLLAVYLCYRKYRLARFKWCIENFFKHTLLKGDEIEEPFLYSNIPLDLAGKNGELSDNTRVLKKRSWYKPLTKEHITRKVRINRGSVVYLGEFSLVANSRLGQTNGLKNGVDYDLLNEQLLLFTKLFGHEVKGGYMVIDSQTISDCHYAIKRVLSEYVYIHHNVNLPIHKILFVKECHYSDDSSTQQNFTEDIEEGLKWLLIPKRKYYKMYDYRCYSNLTDYLPTCNIAADIKTLKANDIISYTTYRTIKKGVKENEKEN